LQLQDHAAGFNYGVRTGPHRLGRLANAHGATLLEHAHHIFAATKQWTQMAVAVLVLQGGTDPDGFVNALAVGESPWPPDCLRWC